MHDLVRIEAFEYSNDFAILTSFVRCTSSKFSKVLYTLHQDSLDQVKFSSLFPPISGDSVNSAQNSLLSVRFFRSHSVSQSRPSAVQKILIVNFVRDYRRIVTIRVIDLTFKNSTFSKKDFVNIYR